MEVGKGSVAPVVFARKQLRKAMLAGCLVVASFASLSADPLVARARARDKAGDQDMAASLYRSWLGLNPGAPGSASVLDAYLHAEQDVSTLLDTGAAFIASGHDVPGAADQVLRLARLFELAGRVQDSRDAFLAAAEAGAGDTALVEAFLLSLEMNDTAAMERILQTISAGNASARALLKALSDFQAGSLDAARAGLLDVADHSPDSYLSLKALWVLYQAAQDSAEAAGYRAKFGARYPGSPEASLAAGTPKGVPAAGVRVIASPIPLRYGTPSDQLAQPDAPTVPPLTPPRSMKTFSVQAGSFQVSENADDLVKELGKIGFAASVSHDTAGGKDRYRVLAAAGMAEDQAKAALARLSAAGFTGLIVAEK